MTNRGVWCLDFTEYERGWGQRDDGTIAFLTKEEAIKYDKDYIKKYHTSPTAPDCYSQAGDPYFKPVTEEVYQEVKKKGSVWLKH